MKTTATDLRAHLFSWLDKVVYTGESPRLARLKKRPTLKVTPEELMETEWSGEWDPGS